MKIRNIDQRVKWLTALEAATYSGKSRKTIWQWGQSGYVLVKENQYKPGKLLYRKEDIEKILQIT